MPPHPLVLIVDDEVICQTIVSSMVRKIGLPTLTASDGREAVEIFARHRHEICCILMDLQMPLMNGMEACRQIREMDANMPVVFASGYLESYAMEQLEPLQPTGYLQKPVGFRELSELLSVFLAVTHRQSGEGGIPYSVSEHSRDRYCD